MTPGSARRCWIASGRASRCTACTARGLSGDALDALPLAARGHPRAALALRVVTSAEDDLSITDAQRLVSTVLDRRIDGDGVAASGLPLPEVIDLWPLRSTRTSGSGGRQRLVEQLGARGLGAESHPAAIASSDALGEASPDDHKPGAPDPSRWRMRFAPPQAVANDPETDLTLSVLRLRRGRTRHRTARGRSPPRQATHGNAVHAPIEHRADQALCVGDREIVRLRAALALRVVTSAEDDLSITDAQRLVSTVLDRRIDGS